MATITNPKNASRSLTHAFHEVEDENGELSTNTPNRNTPIVEWECPRKWSQISYAGGKHPTKFVPRTKQSVAGAPAPSGGEVTITIDSTIQPINGEVDPTDQPYPPVVAMNKTQGNEVVPKRYDYAADEVIFSDADVSDGDELALFPILVRGTIQYRGIDQFGHEIAPLDEWSEPLHIFHDFDQNKNSTQIHLVGSMTFTESESLGVYIDSPDEIVWEDADYPRGTYASNISQRVSVDV